MSHGSRDPLLAEIGNGGMPVAAAGLDNRSISRQLHRSEKTVRNYVSNILTKLHVSTRHEAGERARQAGLPGGHLP